MRKCKQVISLILALTLVFAMLSVGVVQTSAAGDDDVIYTDPPSEPALLGDVNRDGRVNLTDVFVLRSSLNRQTGYLNYKDYSEDTVEFKVADVFKDYEEGMKEAINLSDVFLLRAWLNHKEEAQGKGIGEPMDVSTTATVTIYGLNGQSETREFNVGDTFTVYTSLNAVKTTAKGKIASLSAEQSYTDSVLTLSSPVDDEALFTDSATVFPVCGTRAMGRLSQPGKILYNASEPSTTKPFVFNTNDDLAIVTTYTVSAGGTAEIRNALSILAAADDNLTKIVSNGTVAPNAGTLVMNATFDKPVKPTTPPATQKPTTPPETQKPTTPPATQKPTTPPATQKPTTPPATQKPTTPPATQKPTDPPVTEKATVTISGLDGETEVKTFNVGDTFTVYTTLNTSAYLDGGIGSLNGTQTYTSSILSLEDEYDPDEGDILDTDTMFPITKSSTVANGKEIGKILFNASKASIKNPFKFNSNNSRLIVTNYKVTKAGNAEVKTTMTTLAVADGPLTRIIDKGEIILPSFRLHASYTYPGPETPTFAPQTISYETTPPATTAPATQKPTTPPATQKPTTPPATQKPTTPPATQKPTTPPATQKPTTPPATQKPTTPPATQKPTDPPVTEKATVTISGLDGETEVKTFNVGDTFTVYTTLNTSAYLGGGIGSLNGTQTYTSSILSLEDEYDPDEGDILDTDTMFPITKSSTVANGKEIGKILFNASKASIKNPFKFNSNNSRLIVTNYKVTKAGNAEVKTTMTTLAVADGPLTRIIDKGEIILPSFRLHASYTYPGPETPTFAPQTISYETTPPATTAPATQKPTTPPATQKPTTPPATQKPTTPPATQKPTTPPATQKPTTPPATQKPTTPPATQKPTDPPVTEKATVTISGLDGETEVKTFNVGDTFTVYTTLNTSAYLGGGIGSLNGTQTYTSSILSLEDEYDPDEGDILDTDTMFPITKSSTVANGKEIGKILFNASKASIKNPFKFNSNNSRLIVTNYKVTKAGNAEVKTTMTTLAVADGPLTRIIDKGEIILPSFRLHASYTYPGPETPTFAPQTISYETTPPATTAPATQKPTDPPVTEKATVTISGLDGETEVKTFNVGDTFTVYTTLNTSAYLGGGIGSLNGTQTYTSSILSLEDEYDPDEGDILDTDTMFPITKSSTVANGKEIGKIIFNASKASIKNPFKFNSNNSRLIVTNYKVTKAGNAEVKTTMTTLAVADGPLTRIIDKGEIILPSFRLHASYTYPGPETPTFAPQTISYETTPPATTAPETQKPTTPPATQKPTTPPATQKPTTPPATQKPTTPAPTTPPATDPPATQKPTDPPVTITDGYYLVGSMTDWAAQDAYKFSENTASAGEYMLSTTLSNGDGVKAVKVENGEITTWYPDGMDNEYTVDTAHSGDVTIYFNPTYQSDWSAFGGHIYVDNGITPEPDTITVYFTDALSWGSVNVYYWPNGSDWPGVSAEKYEVNGYGQQVYKATVPASVDGIIFNGNGKQTVDITDGIADNAQWYTLSSTDSSGHYQVGLVGDTPEPTTPQQTDPPASNDVVFEPGDAAGGNPAWFAWVYNGSKADQWIKGTTDSSGNVVFSGAGDFGGMVIVRMPTGASSGAWSGYWNRTGDITIQKGKTLYFTGWNNDYFNTAWK